jgi:hypothetical protein
MAKELKTGGVGKTGTTGAICHKNATNFFKHYKPVGRGLAVAEQPRFPTVRTVYNRGPQVAPRLRGAQRDLNPYYRRESLANNRNRLKTLGSDGFQSAFQNRWELFEPVSDRRLQIN